MKTELDLVRGVAAPLLPVNEALRPLVIAACRKSLNTATTKLVHEGLLKSDLPMVSETLAELMVSTCRILITLDLEPDVENFVYAGAELVSVLRKNLDDALRADDPEEIKLCAVMAELVVKGFCSALDVPLHELMVKVLANERANREDEQ